MRKSGVRMIVTRPKSHGTSPGFLFRDFLLVQVGNLTFWVRGSQGQTELGLDSSSTISEMCDHGQLNFSVL